MKLKRYYSKEQWDYHISHNIIFVCGKEIICRYEVKECIFENSLEGVYVNEKYRGEGYGKMMMEDFLSFRKKMGYKEVKLTVKKDNMVIKLYKSIGFVYEEDSKSGIYDIMILK